ncbi:hypothetical protein C6362_04895 [Megasphaera elsdenii DSM 20460]|nr:hypothetical protein C6362_04895 [Megasphaera elsdenii DSM 20460]
MISVRQTRDLPRPSFRFHLTMDTLGSGYSLPATGRLRDFHPLECAHAGRTYKRGCSLNATAPFLIQPAITAAEHVLFCRGQL